MDPEAARLLDEIAAAATPAAHTAELAGWRCKADADLPFRRANVALPPLGAGSDPDALAAALDRVATWYGDHATPLRVQVSTADPSHPMLDLHLAARDLTVEAPVHVLTRDLATGSSAAQTAAVAVEVTSAVDEAWATTCGTLAEGDDAHRRRAAAYGRMLAAHGPRALGASATIDGRVIGVGCGVIDRGWVGIFAMATAPSHRREGIATAVVAGLEQAGAAVGARGAYLQVETDNHPAIACYHALGYVRSHGYHYRSALDGE